MIKQMPVGELMIKVLAAMEPKAKIPTIKDALQLGTDRTPELSLNMFALLCRRQADQWYYDPKTGERIYHNPGERYMLMTTELAEAFEALRKNKMDDHLPSRRGEEVELADLLIRVFDYCGENNIDLDGPFWEKLAYNEERADHKHENRVKEGGKKW